MSADPLTVLDELLGQHPASIRTVAFRAEPLAPDECSHLEVETKTGQVRLIDHSSGVIYAHPPLPPAPGSHRQRRDLTAQLPGAFNGRPTIESIEGQYQDDRLIGYRFTFSTGAGFTFTLDARTPVVLPFHPEPSRNHPV